MVKADCPEGFPASARLARMLWKCTVALATAYYLVLLSSSTAAQNPAGIGADTSVSSSIRGRVLNRLTHEPISRALVFSADQKYAALTDDYGRFEFKLPQAKEAP